MRAPQLFSCGRARGSVTSFEFRVHLTQQSSRARTHFPALALFGLELVGGPTGAFRRVAPLKLGIGATARDDESDDPEGEVYQYPFYDRSVLERDFEKIVSVRRAFGIEVASVWKRR